MSDPRLPFATLVFPAVTQTAVDYLLAARQRGEKVVCAASVANDEIATEWGPLHRIPSIYDADFARQFNDLVASNSVGRIFCPVTSVFDFMRRHIVDAKLRVELIGDSPIKQQMQQHRQLLARAKRMNAAVKQISGDASPLSLLEIAGILRQASLIYGESNEDKLGALMSVFCSAPKGDVIEIGSLMGRSAFVLLYLAWRFRIGPVLSVDPWQANEAVQHQSPKDFQSLVDEWDFEVLSEGFEINMTPFRRDDHAHLRVTSAQGYQRYLDAEPICSQFGTPIAYLKNISVIHIDGNHDFEAVKNDCELWLTKLTPKSWLILDDYIWAHGDGPYRVGNELLTTQCAKIERAFVCGKALFIQFK